MSRRLGVSDRDCGTGERGVARQCRFAMPDWFGEFDQGRTQRALARRYLLDRLTIVGHPSQCACPGGSYVDVGFAPLVAAMSLGGPIVAGLAALIGATQPRELRRQVPGMAWLRTMQALPVRRLSAPTP
jgi:hypothetical protein